MSHFHTILSNNIFFSFLESICLTTNKYYLFDYNAYKKMFYNDSNNQTNLFENFRDILQDYYNESKVEILYREMTYNRFTSILRQICRTNKITFKSKVKYANSEYCIEHYIYF
jgi:hypothetical protein